MTCRHLTYMLFLLFDYKISNVRLIGRMWCHCRMVYLPMSYLYGKRFVGPITPTIQSLRKELYTVPYHEVDWNEARNLCAKVGDIFLFSAFLILRF